MLFDCFSLSLSNNYQERYVRPSVSVCLTIPFCLCFSVFPLHLSHSVYVPLCLCPRPHFHLCLTHGLSQSVCLCSPSLSHPRCVCLPACPPLCSPISVSPTSVSVCLSVSVFLCLCFTSLSHPQSVCLSICLPVCLPVCLSVCPSPLSLSL